ncbi:hypothetical protein BD779DRAFT_1678453 [Infundibulicybe gibba]|nr:hypothetical protein BD779DRAFT_1678453 [Infundibulicybe gibba]
MFGRGTHDLVPPIAICDQIRLPPTSTQRTRIGRPPPTHKLFRLDPDFRSVCRKGRSCLNSSVHLARDSAFACLYKQKNYVRYLMGDLKDQHLVSFDAFLEPIFGICSDWWRFHKREIDRLLEDNLFNKYQAEYRKRMKNEQERYQPFVNMLNRIVSLISKRRPNSLHIQFARDPTITRGSAAERKLDAFAGDSDAFTHPSRRVELMATKGPSGLPLHWPELLSFLEFKLLEHALSESKCLPGKALVSSASGSLQTTRVSGRQSTTITAGNSGEIISTDKYPGYTRAMVSEGDAVIPTASTTGDEVEPAAETQCASYALELLSHGGLRTHVIGALITDDQIELLYYDRSITMKSYALNFLDRPREFVAWIAGMACLDTVGWGLDPALPRVRRYEDVNTICTVSQSLYENCMKLNLGWEVQIMHTIFSAHCIIGRATTVLLAKVTEAPTDKARKWSGELVAVKLSNPTESRPSEVKIIKGARRHAKITNAGWVLNNLPRIVYHEDRIVGSSQRALFNCFPESYKLRVPRIMIMEQLFPVTDLTNATAVAPVYRDIVKCYDWLYNEREIHGVLNDYDLARCGRPTGPQSMQKTGTKQFMAVDLLNPFISYVHLYRHDLESLFYVILFHLCKHSKDGEHSVPSLEAWLEAPQDRLHQMKLAFFNQMAAPLPPVQKDFAPIEAWTTELYWMFHQGYATRLLNAG